MKELGIRVFRGCEVINIPHGYTLVLTNKDDISFIREVRGKVSIYGIVDISHIEFIDTLYINMQDFLEDTYLKLPKVNNLELSYYRFRNIKLDGYIPYLKLNGFKNGAISLDCRANSILRYDRYGNIFREEKTHNLYLSKMGVVLKKE